MVLSYKTLLLVLIHQRLLCYSLNTSLNGTQGVADFFFFLEHIHFVEKRI